MIKDLAAASNDALAQELMVWFRIYRNECRLYGEEHTYFKALVAEIDKRKMLPHSEKSLKSLL